VINENDKASNEWLNSQKPSTRGTYRYAWKIFLEYAGMTGDQILESRKMDKEYAWEHKTLNVMSWAKEKGLSDNTAKSITTAARSFFAYYRMELNFRHSEKVKLTETEPVFEDYRFSLEDMRKMYNVADLKERYVLCCGKSFGLRAGDFLKLTRGDFDALINNHNEPPIFVGEKKTGKEKVSAYLFIDTDAQPIIKAMLDQMTSQGRTKPSERMLTYSDEEELSRVIRRLAVKAGINVGNKRVRFHCMRKFLSDNLSRFMSESKWKQVVGKKISENAYVSAETLKDDYKRAMVETTFTKHTLSGDIANLAKLEALKAIARNMDITETQMRDIFKMRKAETLPEQIVALENLMQKHKGKAAGGMAFEQVAAKELAKILMQALKQVKETVKP